MPYWLRNEEVRRIEPHRRTWLPLPLFCFSFMLWILPYLLKMVVFPSWLQQIGHLLYDSYEYQGIELKSTIGINWLFRYDYRIAKAGEDPRQRRYYFGNKRGMKSNLQGIEPGSFDYLTKCERNRELKCLNWMKNFNLLLLLPLSSCPMFF